MESIIQNQKECLICKKTSGLHKHHVFYGPLRKVSEKNGLTVWLCGRHHNLSKYGVHFDRDLDLQIKALAQKRFEENHSRKEFMKLIGRNYLEMEERK